MTAACSLSGLRANVLQYLFAECIGIAFTGHDIAKLYREFEDAYVDFLTAEREGVLVVRQKRLYRARTRLLAHKDFTEEEYEAAVLRADARVRALTGQAPL
jgi:hypothetical protein